MKVFKIFGICLLLIPMLAFSQSDNKRMEIEVLIAEENSEIFIPFQTFVYYLNDQSPRQPITLPPTAGRIRLQMYLMSNRNKTDLNDLRVNGYISTDRESFVIEDPRPWVQKGEPLMIVFSDAPFSYYKLSVPIQWSNLTSRTQAPVAYSTIASPPVTETIGAGHIKAYIAQGYAVQIEARKDRPQLQNFKQLQEFGTVYFTQDPSWRRVRVGVYPTKLEAIEKQDAIQKIQGGIYAKAYVVPESGGYMEQLPGLVEYNATPAEYSLPGESQGSYASNIPQAYDATSRGPAGGAQPEAYDDMRNRSTLAERAPKFPSWYYTTASSSDTPNSYDTGANVRSPDSYGTTETLLDRGNNTIRVAVPSAYSETPTEFTAKGAPQNGYYVQAGAYGKPENAERYYQSLVSKGITNATIIQARKDNGEIIYRTWIGPYNSMATAKQQQQSLAKKFKISGTVVSGTPDEAPATYAAPAGSDFAPPVLKYENPGYSLQLSVFGGNPNLNAYRHLENYGRVYLMQDGALYKLKMGPFTTKKAADDVLAQVKGKGFPNAFVVDK